MSSPCRTLPLPVLLGFALFLAFVPSLHAGLNVWTPIGPSMAPGISRLTADPRDPSILYARTVDFRLWRSRDGGASWTLLSGALGGRVRAFAVDGVAAGTLYAAVASPADGSISIWTSADRGDTWRRAFQGSGGGPVQIELTADPNARGTLFQLADGTVSKSTDGGRSWSCVRIVLGCGVGPTLIFTGFTIDPASSERPYAINNVGLVYRSTDGGVTWSDGAVLQPLFGLGVNRIAVSPSDPEIVYAWVSGGGVTGRPCFARSDDRGESWTGVLTGVQCGELAVDPEDGQTLRILVGPERRLWTSRDGGKTWEQGAPAPQRGQILADPTDPDVLLLAGTGGLFRSEDNGAHWSSWARQGFNDTGVRVLAASAEAPGVLFAGLIPERPLQKSLDAGRTWTDLPIEGVAALAADPRAPLHLYAGTNLGVHESTDGGLTWRLAAARPFTGITSLRIHPTDGRLLYAAAEGGVWRSTDGGRTWSRSSQGLPVGGAVELTQDRNPRILYVVAAGSAYRSTNRGMTWQPAGNGLPSGAVTALAADLNSSSVLYAAAAIPPTSAGFVSAIFKSTNGGRSWTRVAAYPSAILDLAVSPSGVYASIANGGVFRSQDAGRSWASVSQGLPDVAVPLLAPDPLVPGRIYAGTDAEGVWAVRFVGN